MHTNTNTICTHGELKRGPIPGYMETEGVEVNLWSCWVSDLLDNSEPLSRVFLFDNILLLVVPTGAICFFEGDDTSRNHQERYDHHGNYH